MWGGGLTGQPAWGYQGRAGLAQPGRQLGAHHGTPSPAATLPYSRIIRVGHSRHVSALPVRASWQPRGAGTRLLLLFAPGDILGAFGPALSPPKFPSPLWGRRVLRIPTSCPSPGEEGHNLPRGRLSSRRGVATHTWGAGKVRAPMAAAAPEPLLRRDGDVTGHLPPREHQWLRRRLGLGVRYPARDTARGFPGSAFCSEHPPGEEQKRRLPRSGSPRGWLVPALPVLHPAGAMATGRAISSIRAFAKSSLRRQTEPGSSPLLASRLLRWGAESTQGWGPALLLPSVPPSPSPGPSPPLCASAGLSVPRGTAFKGHNCNRHQQP